MDACAVFILQTQLLPVSMQALITAVMAAATVAGVAVEHHNVVPHALSTTSGPSSGGALSQYHGNASAGGSGSNSLGGGMPLVAGVSLPAPDTRTVPEDIVPARPQAAATWQPKNTLVRGVLREVAASQQSMAATLAAAQAQSQQYGVHQNTGAGGGGANGAVLGTAGAPGAGLERAGSNGSALGAVKMVGAVVQAAAEAAAAATSPAPGSASRSAGGGAGLGSIALSGANLGASAVAAAIAAAMPKGTRPQPGKAAHAAASTIRAHRKTME